jgi:hypothetical protein
MKRVFLSTLVLAGATWASAAGDSPQWMKLSDALNLSARDGHPIAVFVSVNPNGST